MPTIVISEATHLLLKELAVRERVTLQTAANQAVALFVDARKHRQLSLTITATSNKMNGFDLLATIKDITRGERNYLFLEGAEAPTISAAINQIWDALNELATDITNAPAPTQE